MTTSKGKETKKNGGNGINKTGTNNPKNNRQEDNQKMEKDEAKVRKVNKKKGQQEEQEKAREILRIENDMREEIGEEKRCTNEQENQEKLTDLGTVRENKGIRISKWRVKISATRTKY